MNRPTYDLPGYMRVLRMSHKKHLLVEGDTDYRFFSELLKQLYGPKHQVDVDQVKRILDVGEGLGHREKVETVCQNVEGKAYADWLTGFVDREFREFEIGENICDHIRTHKINGRLVWARGHSVENYFFDLEVLWEPLKNYTIIEDYEEVLNLFKDVFESALHIAGALSLAAREWNEQINRVRGSIGYNILQITDNSLSLDKTHWKIVLVKQNKNRPDAATRLINLFEKWYERMREADIEDIRWICHGHIGFTLLWAAYARCIVTVAEKHGEVNAPNKVKHPHANSDEIQFNFCTAALCTQIQQNKSVYPAEVFQMLGL